MSKEILSLVTTFTNCGSSMPTMYPFNALHMNQIAASSNVAWGQVQAKPLLSLIIRFKLLCNIMGPDLGGVVVPLNCWRIWLVVGYHLPANCYVMYNTVFIH